jgi:hypothetical protein
LWNTVAFVADCVFVAVGIVDTSPSTFPLITRPDLLVLTETVSIETKFDSDAVVV